MTPPSNGITTEVIREIMPPYHLSADLLEATIATLPLPPPDAPAAWRHERITRLVEEIAAYLPANAAQARIAAQILIVRELADTLTNRAHAPEVTVEQMCRLSRASAAQAQTASGLERALARHQKPPVPFFGTVVEDEVDIGALDAVWCRKPMKQSAPLAPATGGVCPLALDPGVDPVGARAGGEVAPDDAAPALVGEAVPTAPGEAGPQKPAPNRPDAAPLAADAGPSSVVTGPPTLSGTAGTDVPLRQIGPVDPTRCIPPGAGSAALGRSAGVAEGVVA